MTDHVPAAAEGLPAITRRTVLAGSAATIVTAGSVTAAAATGAMAAAIGAFQQAEAAYSAALNDFGAYEAALDESLTTQPITFTVESFTGNAAAHNLDLWREDCRSLIGKETCFAIQATIGTSTRDLDVDAKVATLQEIKARERRNHASIDAAEAVLESQKESSGYTAAEKRKEEAEDRYHEALDALLSHRPASLAEVQERMVFLTTAPPFKGSLLNDWQIELLFGSMTGGRA